MEPVEINAGRWYLRALRADERVDDTPALRTAGVVTEEAGADYIQLRLDQWAADELYSWAVCVPETGEMVAEIRLGHDGGPDSDAEGWSLGGWTSSGYDDAFAEGLAAVRRFAESGLGLTVNGQWPG
ncbi:GNAT family N-acetyltransferase [Tomitella biformata]|uniref:GNAT family N-acetyltransferase n=1 Tax=Tomitella biformata TaxID=630403 RepID=UPI0004657FD6|nr:hypothetical protein [Tomitella biformata]